jgi:quinol monooxygenase YgiN
VSVTYIGHSQAKPDQIDAFRQFMMTVVIPAVRASAGCESCQMLQSLDDPTKFVVIEVWESVEAHRASVKNITPESIAEYMQLVAAPPMGDHYRAE